VTVDLTTGKAVLVVTAVQAARTPSFDEWRSKIETDYKQRRAGDLLTQKTQEMADRAHALHDLKAAAKEVGATVKTTDWITRSATVPELGPMSGPASAAFDMQPGQISDAVERATNGGVFEVLEKQAPTPADLAAKKESIRQQLYERKRQMRWQMFSVDLRTRLLQEKKIEINQDEWKRLTGNTTPLEVRLERPTLIPARREFVSA
jgi:peptidyl-prolyl cis-trans isomerase D